MNMKRSLQVVSKLGWNGSLLKLKKSLNATATKDAIVSLGGETSFLQSFVERPKSPVSLAALSFSFLSAMIFEMTLVIQLHLSL